MKPSTTAVHEAGHSVVARLLGIDVGTVSTRPTEASLGNTGHECCLGIPDKEILICYAGYAAEVYFAPELEQQARLGSGDDNEQAEALVAKIDGAHEKVFREQARSMVVLHWKAVQLVAFELDYWETLDQDELDELINLAEGNNPTIAISCLVQLRWWPCSALGPMRKFSRIKRTQKAGQQEANRLQELVANVTLIMDNRR